jgi:hypothetical protein
MLLLLLGRRRVGRLLLRDIHGRLDGSRMVLLLRRHVGRLRCAIGKLHPLLIAAGHVLV